MASSEDQSHVAIQEGQEVEPMMAIGGGPGGQVHTPVHESLTLAALITNGAVPKGTTISNASGDDWEYVRGVAWNDDPDLLLYNDTSSSNHKFSLGGLWYWKYQAAASEWREGAQGDMRNPTGRSHYGDLQFLHCMASKVGEPPADTKAKIMIWLEVMYKLANGEDGITPATKVADTKLSQFTPNGSLPPSWLDLKYLLSKNSPFEGLDIQHRAIGSMFHIIQDSYAIGHTKRTLLNPQDKTNNDPLQFKPGVADQWGAIENFHCYDGQDENAHSHFDHGGDRFPDAGNLGNLDQFNGLVGCRISIDKCVGLMALKSAGNKWDNGVKQYLDEKIFDVSLTATLANAKVD